MKNPTVGKPGVNYYALLGVSSTATQDEVTRAFRKKILQVHLDKMGPDEDTELCYLTIEAHRILSDKALRAKYDVERSSSKDYKAQEEEFIPAGYICYDVGHQQMSRQLLESISNWTSEYDKSADELSDNYFQCFSQLVTNALCDNEEGDQSTGHGQSGGMSYHYCPTCDKRFVTETQHWDLVINPYRAMFFSDQQGVQALMAYFQGLLGTQLFNWEPRYLPSRVLGIWESPEWSSLTVLHHQASNLLKECNYHLSSPTATSNDIPATISKLESLSEESGPSRSQSFVRSQHSFLRRSLIQNLIWVLENKEQSELMISRMSELLCQDDLQEMICLGMAMRNVLSFQQSEWEQLIQEALKEEQFELAMLWTMFAIQSGDKNRGDWFQLGMSIRVSDPVLAHFCFLLSGYCNSPEGWEELANIFTRNGAHYAACEYHLNKGNLFHLLHKSRALKDVDPIGAEIYAGIYYATRVKGLLEVLKKKSRQSSSGFNEQHNEELEELIEMVQDLTTTVNPMEGFRVIVSTWPDVFEEAPGYWIHRSTTSFLRRGKVNLKSAKLILAAAHFLPMDEKEDEIRMVSEEASRLTGELLDRALETNDFEMLTDVLLHLNTRTLFTAEEYLNEINPPVVEPPSVDEEKGDESEEGKEKGEEKEEEKEEQLPTPQQPQPNAAPGHKSAMVLLLSGTIHKVKEEWLDAMKDYQNALLSAPECMHRVLPCVSKLVQDIQFHEAVVSQVQKEILELQTSLVKGEYPEIDKYCSDTKPSLILTDVAPKMDYGYKDCVAKIQQDPDKMPGPPPEDEPMDAPPPAPANTPIVTLDKNSEAIQSGQDDGQIDQLSAALAYVDLLKALPVQMHPGPIVMAASHFLRAMDETEEVGKLYAYRNAIMLMAENLLRVDRKMQATIHHGLTHKHMLSILLSSHEKLSKALLAAKNSQKSLNNLEENEEEEEDEEKNNSSPSPTSNHDDKDKRKRDIIRKSEAHVISKFLKNVVNFPKVEPLANMPTLNCSDLVYVETLGNSFLSQFCADKVRQKHQSPLIPKHLHAYTHFVEVWKGRSTLSDFPQARVKAMEELLALKGWSMGHVERKMSAPFLTSADGFSPPITCLLSLRSPIKSYRSMDGFHIDYETGSVSLLLSRDTINPADTLFDIDDIKDVVSLNRSGIMEKIIFSLETPDDSKMSSQSHPFKEARISLGHQQQNGNSSKNSSKIWSQIPEYIQATLSRVSMLLCYLASGLELSSDTPFWLKRTDEGLLSRLDEHLQFLARPISWRKAERRDEKKSPFEASNETCGKFWLNMVEVFEEIEEDEEGCSGEALSSFLPHSQLTYRVGNMRTEVRPNTLVMTVDPRKKAQKLSPEAEFARDLTRHFEEFGRAFPELRRIEELVKISVVCSKLRQVLKENKALIQEYLSASASCDNNKSDNELKPIRKICATIEEFLGLKQEDVQDDSFSSSLAACNWFPATFCHNMDPDAYDVTAGIELDPVVTYGPVPAPRKPISLPLSAIIGKEMEIESEKVVGNKAQVDVDENTVIQMQQKMVEEVMFAKENVVQLGKDSDGEEDVDEEEEEEEEVSEYLSDVPEDSDAEEVEEEESEEEVTDHDAEDDYSSADILENGEDLAVKANNDSSKSQEDVLSEVEVESEDEEEPEASSAAARLEEEDGDDTDDDEIVDELSENLVADEEEEEELEENSEVAESEPEVEEDELVSLSFKVQKPDTTTLWSDEIEAEEAEQEEELKNGHISEISGYEDEVSVENSGELLEDGSEADGELEEEEVDEEFVAESPEEGGNNNDEDEEENANSDVSSEESEPEEEEIVLKGKSENGHVISGSILNEKENTKLANPPIQNPNSIDGKIPIKIRRRPIPIELQANEENTKTVLSKRSFLSRRTRIMVETNEKLEKKKEKDDGCSDDSDELLSK
ncbi:unnamed protein product [Orchesella dallaii]|uniref:J domain-containing protein n=1 Tax=Orchesella dallaii TaxID=48710 RepID=A0ABP1R2L7_9HEXA